MLYKECGLKADLTAFLTTNWLTVTKQLFKNDCCSLLTFHSTILAGNISNDARGCKFHLYLTV